MPDEILDDIDFEEQTIEPELERDLRRFIQKNADAYIDFKKSNNLISFNLAKLLLGLPWLLYRKLYGVFRILSVISILAFGIDHLFFAMPILGIIYLIFHYAYHSLLFILLKIIGLCFVMILCGLFGDSIYLYAAEREIKSLKTTYGFSDLKKQIYRNGGIELIMPISVVVLALFQFFSMMRQ